jgi:hypothetical protein
LLRWMILTRINQRVMLFHRNRVKFRSIKQQNQDYEN